MKEIIKVCVYEMVDMIPNMLLAVIPFRDHIRHNKYILGLSMIMMYCIIAVCRILALGSLTFATIFTVMLVIIYLGFYRINFNVKFTKLLFILLIILNYGSFIGIIHTYTANRFLTSYASDQYSFGSSGILLMVIIITYPVMYYMMEKKIKPLIAIDIDNTIWKFIWMVPAISCLSYYYSLFANGGILSFSESISNVIFAVVLNLGSLFVTYIVAHLVKESNDSMALKIENYKLNLQNLQYENLQNRIEETRRARHDLRQIMTVIQACLKDNDTERLEKYISQYTESLPADTVITYCENYAVNALIVYYADLCHKKGIRFDIKVCYPADLRITDSDAVILLGNLLENAVEACARQTDDKRYIILHIQIRNGAVVITLDNSYDGKIKKTDKKFLSSKGNRIGIGISTIQGIAAKYNGVARFEYDDQVFHSSLLLQQV